MNELDRIFSRAGTTTASHFANDLAIGTGSRGRPFRAVSLVCNVAAMTAVANDERCESICAPSGGSRFRERRGGMSQ